MPTMTCAVCGSTEAPRPALVEGCHVVMCRTCADLASRYGPYASWAVRKVEMERASQREVL